MPYVDPVVYPPLFADGAVDTYVLFSASTRVSIGRGGVRGAPHRTHTVSHANVSSHVSSEITSSHIHKE